MFSVQTFAVEANNSLELSVAFQEWNSVTVDINVINPSNQQITSVQSWLEFDTDKLKWLKIDTAWTPFDFVVPGESTFDWNIVKIWRSTLSWKTSGSKVFLAKVTFQILKSWWEIRFHDYTTWNWWHVSIQVFDNWFPVNTLSWEPKSLKINWSTVPVLPETPLPKDTGEPINEEPNPILTRPSNVYLKTSSSNATLKWNSVSWAEKYYVYYWKTSWRYLNRRMIWDVNSYTINSLELWKRYFFAITAIWSDWKETDYSNESSVIIWDSTTSTFPYVEKTVKQPTNNTDIKVNNNTDTKNPENPILNNDKKINDTNHKFTKTTETWPAEIAFISLFLAMVSAYWIKRFNGKKLHI